MLRPARLQLRSIAALLTAIAVLTVGTAYAQNGDEADSETPAAEEASTDGGGEGEADAGQNGGNNNSGNKKNRNRDDGELPECEPLDEQSESGQTADAATESEAECTPPARCAQGHIDLAPDADEPNCIDQARLNRLIANFEAAAAEEARALDELTVALDDLAELNELLELLRLRLGEIQIRLASATAESGFAEIRRAVAGESLDDVSSALDAEETHLKAQAVEAYMGGDAVELAAESAFNVIEDVTALELAREYASVVIDNQLATVDQVDALRSAAETLARIVAELEAAAVADASRVTGIESQVQDIIGRQRDLVAQAEAEAEAVAEKIAQIQQRKQAYAEELALRGAGGGAIGQSLRERQADQEPPPTSRDLFGPPLASVRVGSGFGPRTHPIFNDTRLHTGLDISGAGGEPILAAGDGLVVVAEDVLGYGNVVVVDHGNTIATLYAHMSADAVSLGQEVVEGDLLGFVGSTGYSTGPHLHFEVRVKGTPVDPMLYLRFE